MITQPSAHAQVIGSSDLHGELATIEYRRPDLVAEYVAAYQKGGDAAIGAYENPKAPNQQVMEFTDLLRRSTKAWNLFDGQ